jgi:hypothetical protein
LTRSATASRAVRIKNRKQIALGPQPDEDFATRLSGQAEIQKHQIIRNAAQCNFRRAAVLHPVDRESVLMQTLLDALTDHQVVFNQQQSHDFALVRTATVI